jgi:hypothetical protein
MQNVNLMINRIKIPDYFTSSTKNLFFKGITLFKV